MISGRCSIQRSETQSTVGLRDLILIMQCRVNVIQSQNDSPMGLMLIRSMFATKQVVQQHTKWPATICTCPEVIGNGLKLRNSIQKRKLVEIEQHRHARDTHHQAMYVTLWVVTHGNVIHNMTSEMNASL